MFIKKIMAAILSLSLICGGASLVCAVSESINLVDFVNYNYDQMCKDEDLRHYCLILISESIDKSFLSSYEDFMLNNPELFKSKLVSKLSKEKEFRETYLEFLKGFEKYKKYYEDFISKKPQALKRLLTW